MFVMNEFGEGKRKIVNPGEFYYEPINPRPWAGLPMTPGDRARNEIEQTQMAIGESIDPETLKDLDDQMRRLDGTSWS